MTEFLLSGAAIAVLIGFAWALGFRTAPHLASADDAARLADAALTGFRVAEVVLDARGRGALLRGNDGRLVLVRALGDRWVVRVLVGVAAVVDGARLTLRPRGPGERATTLELGADTAVWAARLA